MTAQAATAARATDHLVRDAHVILTNCGVRMSPSKVSRLVRTYQTRVIHNGFAFFDFLVNAVQVTHYMRRLALQSPEVRRVIDYADPTGETAVYNVLKERKLHPGVHCTEPRCSP